MLLIPTFLLLISPINFTIYLLILQYTKHSATIFFIYSFGKIFRVLKILSSILKYKGELLRFL
jgi:hypothetical protein